MEKRDFWKCRGELVQILENYNAEKCELAEVCVAALNELFAASHFVASIQFHDKVSFQKSEWIAR